MNKKRKFVALLAVVLTLAVSVGAVTMASETVINQPVAVEELVNPISVEKVSYFSENCGHYHYKYINVFECEAQPNLSDRLFIDRYGNVSSADIVLYSQFSNQFEIAGGPVFMIYTEKSPGGAVLCEVGMTIQEITVILNMEQSYLIHDVSEVEFDPLVAVCCNNMQMVWRFIGYYPVRDGIGNLIGWTRLYNFVCAGCGRNWF